MRPVLFIALLLEAILGCKRDVQVSLPKSSEETSMQQEVIIDYDTLQWTELKSEDGFVIDIKYATRDNFVKEVVYPCGRMFLKPEVANALFQIRDVLLPEGFRLKLFDGYRPCPAQKKLWDKVPDKNYVAPPSEGSMHSRGVAIDLTLTDLNGKEIEMGTPYDFFGPEAHHNYINLPKEVLQLRAKLKEVMEKHGFQAIRTEWWHYSFATGSYPLYDWQWHCNS